MTEDEQAMGEPMVDLRYADRRSPTTLVLLALAFALLSSVLLVGGLVGAGDPDGLPIWAAVLLLLALMAGAAAVGTFLGALVVVAKRGVRGRHHTRPIISWGPPGSRPEKGAEPVPYGVIRSAKDAERAAKRAAKESEGPIPF